MDPRQRAVGRRRFTKIAVVFGVGAAFVGLGLLLSLVVPDSVEFHDSGGYRGGPLAAYFTLMGIFGAVLMVIAAGDLVVRWVKGPQQPGKRARD